MNHGKVLLVGDNPFQGVSHFSQERAVLRENAITDPNYAARLVLVSLENGADGFMFTLNKTTLSILKAVDTNRKTEQLQIYAMLPDVNEFVRTVAFSGGVLGLGKNLAKDIVLSRNWRAVLSSVRGVVTASPSYLLRSYLHYELGRLYSVLTKKQTTVVSLMFHETVCDMALALDMKWFVQELVNFCKSSKLKPGLETRNLPYLVRKLKEWQIDTDGIVIASPFNRLGFQMCPSREESEKALSQIPEAEVIAFSVLAAGYLKIQEALDYVTNIPQLRGVAIGISKEKHARELKTVKEALEAK